jgi:hypothetical protein
MTTTIAAPSASRYPSHNSKAFNNPSPNMYDYPVDLTPAQAEATEIFTHLLETLKEKDSKYHAKYGKWVERHPGLREFCFQCIRPHVWTFLNGRWSLDALKAVGGDLKSEGRGVYLNGVLGQDKKVRIYVGQAGSIRSRVAQHLNFRYRRDNPSLHYHAMQHSIYNAIGLVAQIPSSNIGNQSLPGMDTPDLLMNVLEMWMCLVFRTLPTQTLDLWLPSDGSVKRRKLGQEGEFGGLNIACPLDQGGTMREWVDLSDSNDPLIRDYLGFGRKDAQNERQNRSNIQNHKIENKDEDTPTQRRINYTERARNYNKHWRQQDNYPSQTIGLVFFVTVATLVGIALLRSGGGPAPKRMGQWR